METITNVIDTIGIEDIYDDDEDEFVEDDEDSPFSGG